MWNASHELGTQLPKLLGSLGVRNFLIRNSALLAKWIWRFLHEEAACGKELPGNKFCWCCISLKGGKIVGGSIIDEISDLA